MASRLTSADLTVEIDHGQLYLYSTAPWADDPHNDAVLRALDDAAGRGVGVADGLVDLVVPFRKSFDAPMRVETWDGEPPDDDESWDHVVEVDFDVRGDRVVFEPSGGFTPVEHEIPSGDYRMRIAGRGYAEAASGAEGMDSYRVQLWPRTTPSAPVSRKSYPRITSG